MILYMLLGMSILLVVWTTHKLRKMFSLFRVSLPSIENRDIEALPTVSLCIPARNETHAMTECLENALSSRYPKLEIIVLDDGSRDGTAHLIKSFAHSGVRFVEGSPLPEGWLGKNHALHELLRESSGSYVLFADVDTHFAVDSIDRMVAYMMEQNAEMVSVLPFRQESMRASAIFATFRHFWSIIGHRTNDPAVASSAWMVKRDVVEQEFAKFDAIKTAVRPEKSIAKALAARKTYRYVISGKKLGVYYEKKLSSQYETNIRIYYPDFGLGGIMVRVAGLAFALLPYLMVVIGLILQNYLLSLVAFAVTLLISAVNAWYLGVLRSNNYGIASLCLPFIMLREVYLLIASFILYRRGKVTWKGRPVVVVGRTD